MPATATRPNSRASKIRRPKMTAEEATSFTGYSAASILQVQTALDARKEEGAYPECECQPYEDTFTFNRWAAQGRFVKKGEKSLRIATFVPIDSKKQDAAPEVDGEGRTCLRPTTAFLFCRCQTEKKESARG
jgi:hypothetical protein